MRSLDRSAPLPSSFPSSSRIIYEQCSEAEVEVDADTSPTSSTEIRSGTSKRFLFLLRFILPTCLLALNLLVVLCSSSKLEERGSHISSSNQQQHSQTNTGPDGMKLAHAVQSGSHVAPLPSVSSSCPTSASSSARDPPPSSPSSTAAGSARTADALRNPFFLPPHLPFDENSRSLPASFCQPVSCGYSLRSSPQSSRFDPNHQPHEHAMLLLEHLASTQLAAGIGDARVLNTLIRGLCGFNLTIAAVGGSMTWGTSLKNPEWRFIHWVGKWFHRTFPSVPHIRSYSHAIPASASDVMSLCYDDKLDIAQWLRPEDQDFNELIQQGHACRSKRTESAPTPSSLHSNESLKRHDSSKLPIQDAESPLLSLSERGGQSASRFTEQINLRTPLPESEVLTPAVDTESNPSHLYEPLPIPPPMHRSQPNSPSSPSSSSSSVPDLLLVEYAVNDGYVSADNVGETMMVEDDPWAMKLEHYSHHYQRLVRDRIWSQRQAELGHAPADIYLTRMQFKVQEAADADEDAQVDAIEVDRPRFLPFANMERLVRTALHHPTTAVFLLNLAKFGDVPACPRGCSYSELYRDIVAYYQFPAVEFTTELDKWWAILGGQLPKSILGSDNFHPNAAAHRFIGQLVTTKLEETLRQLMGFIRTLTEMRTWDELESKMGAEIDPQPTQDKSPSAPVSPLESDTPIPSLHKLSRECTTCSSNLRVTLDTPIVFPRRFLDVCALHSRIRIHQRASLDSNSTVETANQSVERCTPLPFSISTNGALHAASPLSSSSLAFASSTIGHAELPPSIYLGNGIGDKSPEMHGTAADEQPHKSGRFTCSTCWALPQCINMIDGMNPVFNTSVTGWQFSHEKSAVGNFNKNKVGWTSTGIGQTLDLSLPSLQQVDARVVVVSVLVSWKDVTRGELRVQADTVLEIGAADSCHSISSPATGQLEGGVRMELHQSQIDALQGAVNRTRWSGCDKQTTQRADGATDNPPYSPPIDCEQSVALFSSSTSLSSPLVVDARQGKASVLKLIPIHTFNHTFAIQQMLADIAPTPAPAPAASSTSFGDRQPVCLRLHVLHSWLRVTTLRRTDDQPKWVKFKIAGVFVQQP